MTDRDERSNVVTLAGLVQWVDVGSDWALVLLDVGQSECIPCAAYGVPEFRSVIGFLCIGDFLKITGLLQATRKNALFVEITSIDKLERGSGFVPW